MGSTAASPDHLNCCNEGEAGVHTPGGHEAPHPTQTRTAFKAPPAPPPKAAGSVSPRAPRAPRASSTTRIPLPAHTGSPKPTRKLLLHRRFPRLSELWKWGKFSKQKNKDTSSDKPQSSSGGSGTDRGPTPSQHNSHRYSVSFQASSDLPGISCPGRF